MQLLFATELNDQRVEVRLLTEEPEKALLIQLFATIATEKMWNTGGELYAYRDYTLYFGLFINNALVGGLSIIETTSPQPLPFMKVWPDLFPSGLDRSYAELGLLALASEFRGRPELHGILCVSMGHHCSTLGICSLLTETPLASLKGYRRWWGAKEIGEPRLHWGELCHPCVVDIPTAGSMVTRVLEKQGIPTS